jgi:hypothetical protein
MIPSRNYRGRRPTLPFWLVKELPALITADRQGREWFQKPPPPDHVALSGVCPGPILSVGISLLCRDWILLSPYSFQQTTIHFRWTNFGDMQPIASLPACYGHTMAIIKLNHSGVHGAVSQPCVLRSVLHWPISPCLGACISLSFLLWGWAGRDLALRSIGRRGPDAQLRRFANLSQSSWFSLRINNWRSGPWWCCSRDEAQSCSFSGVKCNPNPSCWVPFSIGMLLWIGLGPPTWPQLLIIY